MRYDFVERHGGRWPVRTMCRVLAVSPGGYYDWRGRPKSAKTERRESLVVAIKAIHGQVKARYGSPRLHAELVARGLPCCVNTVAGLMREHGIAAKTKRKFRCTTDSNHDRPVAENLLDRRFEPEAPNRARTADITYISRPARAGCTRRPWRTCIPGRSSAGRWAIGATAGWSGGASAQASAGPAARTARAISNDPILRLAALLEEYIAG